MQTLPADEAVSFAQAPQIKLQKNISDRMAAAGDIFLRIWFFRAGTEDHTIPVSALTFITIPVSIFDLVSVCSDASGSALFAGF